jgi:hypothetical protein
VFPPISSDHRQADPLDDWCARVPAAGEHAELGFTALEQGGLQAATGPGRGLLPLQVPVLGQASYGRARRLAVPDATCRRPAARLGSFGGGVAAAGGGRPGPAHPAVVLILLTGQGVRPGRAGVPDRGLAAPVWPGKRGKTATVRRTRVPGAAILDALARPGIDPERIGLWVSLGGYYAPRVPAATAGAACVACRPWCLGDLWPQLPQLTRERSRRSGARTSGTRSRGPGDLVTGPVPTRC